MDDLSRTRKLAEVLKASSNALSRSTIKPSNMLKRTTPIKRPDPPVGDNATKRGNRNDPSSGKLCGKRALRVFGLSVVVSLAFLGFELSKNTTISVFRLRGGEEDGGLSKSATTVSKKEKHTQNNPPLKPIVVSKQQQKKTQINNRCRYYLAESAIPHGGLGMFTAIDIREGEQAQSLADICIFIENRPKGFGSHSYGRDMWHGRFEGSGKLRSACEGFATLFNTMPHENDLRTSRLVHTAKHNDNAGLHRARYPGAGAITQFVGINTVAARDIRAGSELTFDYGDSKYNTKEKEYVLPTRTVDWLENHGMCVDNIKIQRATDPQMGRGAFAARDLPKGSLVVPAPLQFYRNRTELALEEAPYESIFLNYCLQPRGLDVLLYPYGPGVNLINHAPSGKANVELRWSTSYAHHSQWLQLPMSEFWDTIYHGSLILDVVALRDISEGEELFLDYGPEFETAWKKHAKEWVPVEGAENYVYPNDMDIANEPFRTVEEQRTSFPYPENLVTICEPHFSREDRESFKPRRWKQRNDYDWPEERYLCNVLRRERNADTNEFEYEVSVGWHSEFEKDELEYIVRGVPQRAIMFAERPYTSDMYLPNAFRHPIALPDSLVPDKWRSWH